MFPHFFQSIDMIAIYPIVSLIIFFTLFVGVVVWALRADPEYIRAMERLPLDPPSDL
ncbi:MAG TPA: CcoQ/FixQ family Cbb3-type cytochrome c oxidase assembly chaperone [Bacteroidota bacterium]|nr:CcoQ/FixQ family Cbb3-type cytochrome c oxidase assembly chaperone [Bacteroidota bacterium]